MRAFASRHSVCSRCLRPINAKLCLHGNEIVMQKDGCQEVACSQPENILISSRPEYFFKSWISNPSSLIPRGLSGLIIEVTDDCNLRCTTCIAGSAPGAGNTKTLAQLKSMIDKAASCTRKPDFLMISGGEPSVHPEIVEVLQYACDSPIGHVFLITNGKRISEERTFVESLAKLPSKFEIYLQFDSLRPEVLRDIRGEDLSQLRTRAMSLLNEFDLATTLVCVVKRGINNHLCGEVISYAASYKNVRGVTFQPMKVSGRNDNYNGVEQLVDLAEVRQELIIAGIGIGEMDLLPHPMNPENVCIGYFNRGNRHLRGVTGDMLSKADNPLVRSLFFLPAHNTFTLQYETLFRITIVSFMDKFTFAQELLPYSPIGFVTTAGATVPLDIYYMFGRTNSQRAVPNLR